GDMYRADRLHIADEPLPQPERGEDPLRAVRERRDPGIEARLLEPRRVARFDEHGTAAGCGERDRERRADEPASDDQDIAVETALHATAHAALPSAVPTARSTSSASTGSSAVSTSQPWRVTTTSSSMRMPMPRHAFALPAASGAT